MALPSAAMIITAAVKRTLVNFGDFSKKL